MFGKEVESAAQAHAMREYPKESCGLVIDGRYDSQLNIAEDVENYFEIQPSAFRPNIEAIIHSHCAPRHGRDPSAADMAFQIEQQKPFGIVHTDGAHAASILWWGDFRLDDPLEGREFIHGVLDCYGLVRAWFWQTRRFKPLDFPHDPSWWSKGNADLYAAGIAKAGFVRIDASQAKPGDGMLFKSSAKGVPPHHAGVLIDENRLLHHKVGERSKITLINPLLPFIHSWYRHVN